MTIDGRPEKSLVVECGALTEVPAYCDDRRARNWFAAPIVKDPRAPGGLGRSFWPRAHGEFYYLIPPNLALPSPFECGADSYSARGRADRNRVFGVFTAVSSEAVRYIRCVTAAQAIGLAREITSVAASAPEDHVRRVVFAS